MRAVSLASVQEIGWRLVDGCALLVPRTGRAAYRLDHAATELWLAAVADRGFTHPGREPHTPCRAEAAALVTALLRGEPRSGIPERVPGGGRPPCCRRIDDMAEVTARISAVEEVTSRPVGDGCAVCTAEGLLIVLTGHAALIWKRITAVPATFVELLDVLCGEGALAGDDAEAALVTSLGMLHDRRLLRGVEALRRFEPSRPGLGMADAPLPAPGAVRALGALAPMRSGAPQPRAPRLGTGPAVRDAARIGHAAIVCQYGIRGLAPGVDAYAQRCIAAVAALDPDLVIVSGGGRHGLAAVREAESVLDRYRFQVPGAALWLEKYSMTTWENLQHSLEMLMARGQRPSRISLVGDRARTEKLRLCCWLARRRFRAFRDARFDVVPVTRARSTWRDTRIVQLVAGSVQVLSESRRPPPAVRVDAA